ncbi:WD_REPEATS_REGION domain-containing protein [Linnemannia elongata]|nr:WD_REPEATS_REGION domain-containing protein [Linnemannia elongata]
MSSSLPQNNSPPKASSPSHPSPKHEQVTNDISRAIPQSERPTKVARLSSSWSTFSATQETVHYSNDELCASFSGLLLSSSSAFVTLSITSSQNERTQAPPTLEDVVSSLRTQRLSGYKQTVYIPPLAKPSLLAPDETSFPLMEKVEEFLTGDGQVMLVLGDSGAGKSTFIRHLELRIWQDYKPGGIIPLLVNLPALDRPEKDLVAEYLRSLGFSEEPIWDLRRTRQFALICDGYDESQLTCNLHTTNLLNQSGQWSAKLIITCRTQYLGQNYRDRFEPQGRSHYDFSAPEHFRESVIAPFSKDQIEEYVARYVPLEPRTWTKKDYIDRLTTIPGLMGLVKNPFLLSLALGALPAVVEGKDDLARVRVNRVQLYDNFVQHWLRASKRRLRNQNLKLSRDEQRMIDELLDDGFEESGIKFQADLAAAIYQKQEGKPVVEYNHRGDKFCPPPAFNNEFAPQGSPESASAPTPTVDHPLSKRSLVTEQSIVQFLAQRAQMNPHFKLQLLALLEQSKTDERASQAAANAITILVRARVRFNGADLRGIRIPGADLSGGQFDSAQLQEADLTGAILIKCWLRQVNFTNARLDGVQFGELPYLEEDHWVHTSSASVWQLRHNGADVEHRVWPVRF